MPTSYIDQFFVIDPGNPPAAGTALTMVKYNFVDNNDNGFIETGNGDTVNGLDVTRVWVNDTITVTMGGVTQTITGVTFYVNGGPAVFTPNDGTILQDAVFQSSTYVTSPTQTPVAAMGPPCFTAGTLIETVDGPRPVETLKAGDMVMTMDNGPQPVRWIGTRVIGGRGRFAPVRFTSGVLGNTRDILVSPQHRMLIGGWRAEMFFGEDEVLVAAKHMVDGDRIHVQPVDEVTYVHVLFDRHEVIYAEGAASESFYPGDYILSGNSEMRDEVLALFPELALGQRPEVARPSISRAEARVLAAAPLDEAPQERQPLAA